MFWCTCCKTWWYTVCRCDGSCAGLEAIDQDCARLTWNLPNKTIWYRIRNFEQSLRLTMSRRKILYICYNSEYGCHSEHLLWTKYNEREGSRRNIGRGEETYKKICASVCVLNTHTYVCTVYIQEPQNTETNILQIRKEVWRRSKQENYNQLTPKTTFKLY